MPVLFRKRTNQIRQLSVHEAHQLPLSSCGTIYVSSQDTPPRAETKHAGGTTLLFPLTLQYKQALDGFSSLHVIRVRE